MKVYIDVSRNYTMSPSILKLYRKILILYNTRYWTSFRPISTTHELQSVKYVLSNINHNPTRTKSMLQIQRCRYGEYKYKYNLQTFLLAETASNHSAVVVTKPLVHR